jgi:hypothetical protein
MNKEKKIFIIVIIALLLVILSTLLIKNSTKKTENDLIVVENNRPITLDEEGKSNIEEDFYEAISEVKELYEYYDSENFDVYFSASFVSNYMESGSVEILDNIGSTDFEDIDVYDLEGKELEEFPTAFSDGTEIQYESESYEIKPNKNYLLKIYSDTNLYCYYYILKYDKSGNASLKEICYTIGETESIDEEDINED